MRAGPAARASQCPNRKRAGPMKTETIPVRPIRASFAGPGIPPPANRPEPGDRGDQREHDPAVDKDSREKKTQDESAGEDSRPSRVGPSPEREAGEGAEKDHGADRTDQLRDEPGNGRTKNRREKTHDDPGEKETQSTRARPARGARDCETAGPRAPRGRGRTGRGEIRSYGLDHRDRMRRDRLAPPRRIATLVRLDLDGDPRRIDSQRLRESGDHCIVVGRETGTLGDHGCIDIGDPEAAPGEKSDHSIEDHARRTRPSTADRCPGSAIRSLRERRRPAARRRSHGRERRHPSGRTGRMYKGLGSSR